MYEIKVDEPQEEKKQRVAKIRVKSLGSNYVLEYAAEANNIKSMNNVLHFVGKDGIERVFSNVPYELTFYNK